MKRVIARQVNPELQESPLEYFGGGYDVFSVFGNRQYHETMTDVVEKTKNTLDGAELYDELQAIKSNDGANYETTEECIMDYLPPENGGKYTENQLEELEKLISDYTGYKTSHDLDVLCEVLSIVDGKTYDWTTIRGCCQGDWNYCVYPADADVKSFEVEYFNLGSEWMVSELEEGEKEEDCDDGYTMYVYSWDETDMRKEIADSAGCKPENVTMYKFAGYIKTPKYELIEA